MDLIITFAPLLVFMLVLAVVVIWGGSGQRGGRATLKDWISLILFFGSLLLAFVGGVTSTGWLLVGPAIILLIISTLMNWSPKRRRN